MIEEADIVIASLKSAVITGGEVTEEGMHFYLEDGRVVIIYGSFILGVTRVDKTTIN